VYWVVRVDERLKKRILMFYIAGFLNLVLGFYVLFHGRSIVGPGTWYILLFFFFGFAAVDFWFARSLKRKWIEAYQQAMAQREAAPTTKKNEGGGKKN